MAIHPSAWKEPSAKSGCRILHPIRYARVKKASFPALPVWLAPTQALVIPVAGGNLDYARRVGDGLAADGFRVEVDGRRETMKAKIRDAQLQKVPYTLVVGNREEQAGGASVRLRAGEDLGMLGLSELRDRLRQAVETKGAP